MTLLESFSPKLPRLVRDYLDGKPEATSFAQFTPDMDGLKMAASERRSSNVARNVLAELLRKQAKASKYSTERTFAQIERLKSEEVYTVTTGHQLCIYGGPLFFFYKILSAIKLSEQLHQENIEAVPIYWMASEDHDFEEINHIWLKGQKIEWNQRSNGAVGDLMCGSLKSFVSEVRTILKDDFRYHEILDELDSIYAPNKSLSEATRDLVYRAFADTGVVVIDANEPQLKALFAEHTERELNNQFSSVSLSKSNQDLLRLGYDVQVTGREINLFWIEQNYRSRIIHNSPEQFATADARKEWSRNELISMIDSNPECFSPNVVLRPLYQEVILPNIAYIGGPGELSYWLQLKGVFETAKVNMPVVILRDMFMISDEVVQRKMSQLGLRYKDLYKEFDQLLDELLRSRGTHESIVESRTEAVEQELTDMVMELQKIYPGLRDSAEAEMTRILKRLHVLKKKVFRADRQSNQTTKDRLEVVFQAALPNGVPQERVNNWLNFFYEPREVNLIAALCDPLEAKLKVILGE